ncbi:MAG: type II secretion system F family protein [Agarilytica sp.]
MAQYRFQGHSSQGQSVAGQLEAVSAQAAAGQLAGRGITPVKIDEAPLSEDVLKKVNVMLGSENVSSVDLIMFCRQMYTITKAGIPLTRGIRGLSASLRHEYFRDVLNEVVDRLESGVSLSLAMKNYPKVFNELFVSMINVGESSGKLDEVFRQIGFYIERDDETVKRIKSAMRYPSFVMLALLFAVITVNIFVVPAFAKMFEKFGADLPIVTKILIGSSNLFVNYWHLLIGGTLLVVVGFFHYIKTTEGAIRWGEFRLKMPIVGDIVTRASMARYSRSFSLMLYAGVPITKALTLCAAAIDNPYLEEKIQKIREGIERGESLVRTHLQSEMFTPLVLQMVAVGEESGQVEELLSEVAEFYEREVDYDLKTLTDRIEPILIVVMAVFVGILALGIFLPMWSMFEIQN